MRKRDFCLAACCLSSSSALLLPSHLQTFHARSNSPLSGGSNARRLLQQSYSNSRVSRPQRRTALFFTLEDLVFNAESTADALANSSLKGDPSNLLTSLPIMYGAGLLTSVSPCVWGLLPLTMSYISQAAGERSDKQAFLPTLVFASGLAIVFCSLGVAAAQLGGVFGSTSNNVLGNGSIILPLVSNSVCLVMGLQLLDLIRLPLPTLNLQSRRVSSRSSSSPVLLDGTGQIINSQNDDSKGSLLRVFLLGGSSALIASPCATPVLTSILAFVATAKNASLGGLLLLGYTLGYSTPLLWIAGTGGQALARLKDDSRFTVLAQWVTPLSAAVLLWYGTNGILTALLGDPSLAGAGVIP